MTFGGPQILDCYLHTAKPSEIYSPPICSEEKKEDTTKKATPKAKVQRPPIKKKKKEAEKEPLPLTLARANLRKRPGRPKKQ